MLRVLMISPIPILPMNAGDRVRIWHMAQGLARHTDLTLVVPEEGPLDQAKQPAFEPLACRCVRVPWFPPQQRQKLKSFASAWPYHVALRYRENILQAVKQLLAEQPYDLIYCHFLSTLPYAVDSGLPVIWDQHNVDRAYWQNKVNFHRNHPVQKALLRWNLAKVRQMEAQMAPKVAGIVAVSPADQALTQQWLATATPCFVAPNGVDPAYYHFAARRAESTEERQPLVLGFFGSLDLELNQTAALTLVQQILPRVIEQLPEQQISLLLLGRNPPQWLRERGAQTPNLQVTLTGTVDDVRPYLQQMDILVLPLQSGAGTKLRVVEAMATGVCIVGSALAVMGLAEAQAGQHYQVAETPEQFASAICALARNSAARQQMAVAARKLVEEHYQWQHITQRLAKQLECRFGVSDAPFPIHNDELCLIHSQKNGWR